MEEHAQAIQEIDARRWYRGNEKADWFSPPSCAKDLPPRRSTSSLSDRLIVESGKTVRDSLHCALAFLDSFLRSVRVEQAKVGQPRPDDEVGRLARHATAADPHLHDVEAGGQHVDHGRHLRRVG
jgi:hypothetical protein